jgi:6-phosphogluconolactonase
MSPAAIGRRHLMAAGAGGAAALAATAMLPTVATAGGDLTARFAYVGTYTKGAPGGTSGRSNPVGVSAFSVNPATGALTHIQTVPSVNPSFLAIHPTQRYLYVTNEINDYEGTNGSIEAYAIDGTTGMLTFLNRVSTGGAIPAQLAVDPTGRFVVIGNYIGANYTLLPIAADGRIMPVVDTVTNTGSGPQKDRQEAPHPHATEFDPAGRYIATADLGIDKIQVFRIDAGARKLEPVSEAAVAPGSGPRHVAFHPNGRYLYVINELNATIAVLPYDAATGRVSAAIQTIGTVPADFPPHKSTAEIKVHPSGRFLYGSNRKFEEHPLADSIVAYRIDPGSGRLTLIGHTTQNIAFPRHFNLDPTGTYLYACNQKGDTIVQFAIDQASGELRATGRITETPVPVSLVWKTAAGGLPGMPSTGAGGASPDMSLGLLAAVGLGAAALARLRRRPSRRAPDAGTPAED